MGQLTSDIESWKVVGELYSVCKSESTWAGVIPTEKHPIEQNAIKY